MTEFDYKVELQRERIGYDKWRSRVKYLHINNGCIETGFNDGSVMVEDCRTGKITNKYPEGCISSDWKSSVINSFKKAITKITGE
jgi:hypothetical protein